MVENIDISTVKGVNEDLTVQENVLKFKDRDYEPNTFSGKGYKILRIRNENCNTGNCLIQADIMDDSTVYEIRYDFDLQGNTIIMPKSAVLQFKGGSIKNGTLQGDNTIISGFTTATFTDVKFTGTFILDSQYVTWEEIGNDNNAYACYITEEGKLVKLMDLTTDTIDNITEIKHKDSGYQAYSTNEEYRTPLWYDKDDDTWRFADGIRYDVKRYGSSSERPTNVPIGFEYFDTTLGRPIWFTGSGWEAAITSGELAANFSATASAREGTLAASVNLSETGVFEFQFSIPAGEPGKDGATAIEGRVVFCYKESITKPARPTGGSINVNTNEITYPSGWVAAPEDMTTTVWMSQAMFNSFGTIIGQWSDPIRMSGIDGEPGKDGASIEFIYKRTVNDQSPARPESINQDDYVPDGWYDHPSGVDAVNQYEWFCSRQYRNNAWTEFTDPAIWSKYGVNGIDGDGVEYIFTRTTVESQPSTPVGSNEDDYVPSGWTDNPVGVNNQYRYEWVSKRKYNGATKIWGTFSIPAIWAKWSEDGEKGDAGDHVKVKYAVTDSANIVPPLVKTEAEPGSLWQDSVPKLTGSQVMWRIEAMFSVRNELVGEWSDPVLISGTASAAPGDYTEFRYQLGDSKDQAPELDREAREPDGWSLNMMPVTEGKYLWVTSARIYGYDNTLLYPWSEPVNISGWEGPQGPAGLDGLGSAVLDIDNEMVQLLCDDNGAVLSGLPVTIHFGMYYGDDEVTITEISNTSIPGVTVTNNVSEKSSTITAVSAEVEDSIAIVYYVKGTYQEREFERSVVFRMIKIKNGNNAIMYQLAPSTNSIKVDKSGTYSEQNIFCGVNKIDGTKVTALITLEGNLRMTRAVDDGSEVAYNLNEEYLTTTASKRIVFKLYDNNVMIDVESIPILKDGINQNWYSYVYKKSDTKPEKPTGTSPMPSGWLDYPDDSGQWWQCIGTVDGNTGQVTAWSEVLPVNGRDGTAMDGKRTEFRFAVNNSNVTPPTLNNSVRTPSGWSTTPPEKDPDQFLWLTTCTILPNDTIDGLWSDPTCISGESGPTGPSGPQGPIGPIGFTGPAGHDGVDGLPGISFEIRYSLGNENYPVASTSSSTLSQRYPSGWSTTIPTVTDSYPYVWAIQARIDPQDDSIQGGQWQVIRLSGINGMDGVTEVNRSQVVYPAGIYNVNTTYTCDDNKAPYVYDPQDEAFYVLNVVMNWRGSSMGYQYPHEAPSYWVKMESYEAIYTKLLLTPNATIGEMMFNNEFVFSTQGKNSSGGASNSYEEFNHNNPMSTSNSFRPNYCLNCETGEIWFGAGSSHFDPDGSGELANGNISWTSNGNLTVTGKVNASGGNIGGWKISNNVLTSQDGDVWLNGTTGEMRLKGTLQMSTSYNSNFEDANIFYLPATSSQRTIYLGQGKEHIGKICKFYNSGAFGQANYMIQCYSFTDNFSSGISSAVIEYSAVVGPQETVEMTCLELRRSSSSVTGRWEVTSRFSQRDMFNTGSKGRYPLMIGMGMVRDTGTTNPSISGDWWDGRQANSVLSVSRTGIGTYRISFSSSNVPSEYMVFLTGYGTAQNLDTPLKANLQSKSTTNFVVVTSDDDSPNNGSFEFMILAPGWQYNMQ